MTTLFYRISNIILPIFTSLIFLDSLRYKFTNAPETQVIFGLLDGWASTLGAPGLFAQTGLFSQYVIGSAELLASACLLLAFLPGLKRLRALRERNRSRGDDWRDQLPFIHTLGHRSQSGWRRIICGRLHGLAVLPDYVDHQQE